MIIPNKKLKNGFEMPVFGFGTWTMGGRFSQSSENDDEADILAIKRSLDAGITHIDTAEIYAAGHAEELVRDAIRGYDRKKLFIASKVYPTHLRYDDAIQAAEASLKRLGIDYLDLYLIHAPNTNIALRETMGALDYLKDKEVIRNIGVSNFTAERLAEAQAYTKRPIVTNQVHYNLIFREPERKRLLEYCQINDVMLTAWRPVQKGLLAEANNPLMREMLKKYEKTPAQIAINWLISQKNVVTIAKMSDPKHLEENLGAIGWEMNDDDIERLRTEFPGQQSISDAVPLG